MKFESLALLALIFVANAGHAAEIDCESKIAGARQPYSDYLETLEFSLAGNRAAQPIVKEMAPELMKTTLKPFLDSLRADKHAQDLIRKWQSRAPGIKAMEVRAALVPHLYKAFDTLSPCLDGETYEPGNPMRGTINRGSNPNDNCIDQDTGEVRNLAYRYGFCIVDDFGFCAGDEGRTYDVNPKTGNPANKRKIFFSIAATRHKAYGDAFQKATGYPLPYDAINKGTQVNLQLTSKVPSDNEILSQIVQNPVKAEKSIIKEKKNVLDLIRQKLPKECQSRLASSATEVEESWSPKTFSPEPDTNQRPTPREHLKTGAS